MADAPLPLEQSRLRSRGGCLFLGLPMLLVPLVIGAYGMIWGMGIQGRAASGERTLIAYEGCEAAGPAVLARVERMGLGDPVLAPVEGGFTITARMPEDRRIAAEIPLTLVQIGVFELFYGDDRSEQIATASDVIQVFPRMTGDASATTVVMLEAELAGAIQVRQMQDPDGHLEVWIDGEHVVDLSNKTPITSDEIDIEPEPEHVRDAIELAASRGIVLADPLPCAIDLVDAQPVTP